MPPATDDRERLAWVRESLRVSAFCEILDVLGYPHQAMHHRLRPLDTDQCVFAGRARTFRWTEAGSPVLEDPYGLEIDALDSLKRGDVVVHSTDPGTTHVPWGELLSTVAQRNGAVGCVCDGLIRDGRQVMALRFPVIHAGIRPLDARGRGHVIACDVPVRCGDVLVHPGDLVFADFDGVVVVPRPIEDTALRLAEERICKENATRHELLRGRSLRDVFNEFGVL